MQTQQIADPASPALDKAEFEVYDRQLRLWGFEAQARMKESKVLLIGFSNSVTELARHLVLSGINVSLVSIEAENEEVQEFNYQTDFLFDQADAGKKKGNVIVDKLSEMNPFSKLSFSHMEGDSLDVRINKLREQISTEKLSCVVYGLDSCFQTAANINMIASEASLPFYCLNSSGLNAFFFCDLATDSFEFQHSIKDPETGATAMKISSSKGSLSFKEYKEKLLDTKQELKWNKRDVSKPEKLILLALVSAMLKGKSTIEEFIESKQGLAPHKAKILASEEFKRITEQFTASFEGKLQFNPSSGVIGAVASQEIIKVITKKDNPQHGLFLYDGTAQKIIIQKLG